MAKQEDYDYLFKIVLIGSSGVGKSNILSRYTKNTFTQSAKTTVGVEFASKKIKVKQKIFKIQIWDTAGQERYKSIARAYYKGAVAALLVYDITCEKSFQDLTDWYNQINQYTTKNEIIIMLVGNKLDLQTERKIKRQRGLEFAQQRKLAFHQVSAFDGTNIDHIFQRMVQELYNLMIKASEIGSVIKPAEQENKKQQKKNNKEKQGDKTEQAPQKLKQDSKGEKSEKKQKKCC